MNLPASIRILLVDDHAVVVEGLSMVLSRFDDFELVGAASGGAEAVDRVAELLPDLVLMDLSMPGVDGVEATRRITALHPAVHVLALTAFLEPQLVTGAVDAGARGYLLKSASGEELATAIRTVATGGATLTPDALPMLAPSANGEGYGLTRRELDVLALLVDGLANKQIAGELGLSPGTVRIHVSNILAKLQVENRTAAAVLARDRGLVTTTPDDNGRTEQGR